MESWVILFNVSQTLLIIFMGLTINRICSKSSCTHQYHLVFESKTWTEAQRYCRQNYIDLATIENIEEMKRLIKTVRRTFYGSAWIGLYDDLNSWRWSLDNTALEGGFKSWFVQQQVNSVKFNFGFKSKPYIDPLVIFIFNL
uniref:C-type lectin domain-containing protein n=1 Tax=Cyprinus carpio TaxID=7962 RepID=A0A8C1MU92_CYPCA